MHGATIKSVLLCFTYLRDPTGTVSLKSFIQLIFVIGRSFSVDRNRDFLMLREWISEFELLEWCVMEQHFLLLFQKKTC